MNIVIHECKICKALSNLTTCKQCQYDTDRKHLLANSEGRSRRIVREQRRKDLDYA